MCAITEKPRHHLTNQNPALKSTVLLQYSTFYFSYQCDLVARSRPVLMLIGSTFEPSKIQFVFPLVIDPPWCGVITSLYTTVSIFNCTSAKQNKKNCGLHRLWLRNPSVIQTLGLDSRCKALVRHNNPAPALVEKWCLPSKPTVPQQGPAEHALVVFGKWMEYSSDAVYISESTLIE